MTSSRGLGLLLVVLLSGCGTILGYGGDREVRVITNPAGAELLVDGMPAAERAPSVVLLDPAEEHRVDAKLDDLRGGTQVKRSSSTGLVILDIVFTLGLGIWVDWTTGALYDFPETVVVNLGRATPKEPPLAAQYPPPPALMPHTDPLVPVARPAPAPKRAPEVEAGGETRQTNLLQAAPCEICGEAVAHGATACASCGQPR